ncbi:MAG TPA: GNAT family N-acetyltransferase [Nocardioides sp.]|nr:GNAT family N-acetyltransferase [Nocardioides sp.]
MPPVGPHPSLHVRPATDADVSFLTDVVVVATRSQGRLPDGFDEAGYRAGFAEWTREQVAGTVEHSTTYVIEVDGERAGRLRIVRAPDHWELAGIQLLPAHQGRGLGTHLIDQFLGDARAAGLPAQVRVETDNPAARRLYERLGFAEVGRTADDILLQAAT